ncbi:MAG: two-component regulator propeller domain-containing protein [Ginsengibacter sp.]
MKAKQRFSALRLQTTITVFLNFFCLTASSQQYNFTNYSVEQGLVQSQAQDIIQDNKGFLWIPTLGGLSRFDGLNFYNYSKKEGLSSLLIFKTYADDTKLWLGMQDGICSYNGRVFENYRLPPDLKSSLVTGINESKENQIYFHTSGAKLFTIRQNKIEAVKEFENNFTTSIAADKNKNLHVAVFRKGIYRLSGNEWKLDIDLQKIDTTIIVKEIFFDTNNKIWLLSNKGIYTDANGHMTLLISPQEIKSLLTCVAEDAKGRIWVGTSKGAYIVNLSGPVENVAAASGLTDNSIEEIIKDREGNLWFATDGDGIYKLTNNSLGNYNSIHGLNGNVVMGLTLDDENKLWLGTSEGGLAKYDNKKFINYKIAGGNEEAQKTNSLLYGSGKQLWIGTLGGGLWTLKNGNYSEVLTENGNHFKEVVSIYEDSQKIIWVCVGSGVFYYGNGVMHKVPGLNGPCFSVMEMGKDTMLVGSAAGLWQITGKSRVTQPGTGNTNLGSVNCFAKWKNYILLGTEDAGIIFWNPGNGATLQCASRQGMTSDFIFSLFVNNDNTIFAGTGHGISKILVNENQRLFTIKNYSSGNNLYGPECNLNAIQKTSDGNIWFGTTKGLVVYNPKDTVKTTTGPLIYLSAVQLFSKQITGAVSKDTIEAWNNIPYNLKLSHKQNHLTFEVTGLYFTNSSNLKYRYKLEGADTAYSELVSTPRIIFSNLSPGKYHFKAFAVSDEGVRSGNSIDFPFEITAPFYQMLWFKLLTIFTLLALGGFIQYNRNKLKFKRAAAINKMRMEEQLKIQERTSEDLHDDLGNKITRIAVLADVLQNKINKDDIEKNKLVAQIKENAHALYLGTKDIIWSLSPGNDNLYDILDRCKDFGISLFDDTSVEFKTDGFAEEFKEVKIPITISRNLVMIVKETLNNILKHAAASNALFRIIKPNEKEVHLFISDNGTGINATQLKTGNGLGNIRKRVERMGGKMEFMQTQPTGTTLKIIINIPPKEG